MKKILLSSLIAVMAVSAANAKIASTDYADSVADAAEAAAISTAAADATTKANAAESNAKADTVTKLDALDATVSATDGVVTGVTQENGKITGVASAKVTSAMIADNAGITKAQLADTVQQSLTKADNAATTIGSETLNTAEGSYVSGKTLTGAINALDTAIKDVSGGNLKLGTNAVDTINIKNGAVTEDKLNTDLATKINNKANSEDVYTKTQIDTVLGENGTTGQAIAAAAQAAATAQSTADDAVSVNAEQATDIANLKTADNTINAKFVNLGDKTVAQAITDNIAEITATVTGNAGVIKTLSQTAGKVSATRELVAPTDLDTTVNAAITDANNAASFMRSVQDATMDQANADKAYVLTASRGQDNTWIYTWEEIDRTALAVGD